MVPCLDLRHKVTHSEIPLLINIDVSNMTCQIGDEYKLFLIIQRIIEQHKFTVVYLASFVVINCCIPDVSCQSSTLKSSVMNSLLATGSVPVLQSRLLNSFFPATVLGDFCLFIFEVPVIVILNLQKYWTAAWSSDMVLFCFFLTELYKFVIANSLWILVLPRHGLSVWVPEMISPAVSS